jgi:DNA-binding CsgD family transcriptional regulator
MAATMPLELRAQRVAEQARTLLGTDAEQIDLRDPGAVIERLGIVCAALHEELRAPRPLAAERAAVLGERLRELTALEGELRADVFRLRLAALGRIHDAFARLRALTGIAELIPVAARELGQACGFDRTVISRLRGSAWRAEEVWTKRGLDPEVSAATRAYLTATWTQMLPQGLEAEVARRRSAVIIRAGDPRETPEVMAVSRSRGYVATPVMPTGRVIGFLQADCIDRDLTELDGDNLFTFAEGFGLIFERLLLQERLGERRTQVRERLAAAERALAALSGDRRLLTRREEGANGSPATRLLLTPTRLDRLLTPREREVLDVMVTGASNSEIALRLVISEATVKSHVDAIRRKLHASTRAGAVSRYLQLSMQDCG